jgi:RNA polymerase sigma factor (sigma-70 family)
MPSAKPPRYEEITEGEDMMSLLITLPTPALQEDFTEFIFSDLLRSLFQKQEDASEAEQQSEDQLQQVTLKSVGRGEDKQQLIEPTSALRDATDAALVEQAATGNERAFEVLVERYETQVRQFVYHHLARTEEVQDIVQFVFLQLYLYLPRLQGNLVSTRSQQPLKAWLLQVARNRCFDERRKKPPFLFSELNTVTEAENSPLEDLPDTAPLPEEAVEQQDQQRLLQNAIQTLPPHFRSIVSLRYREGLTFREIGIRLNIPENTAKTYFQRARPLLRTVLASLWEEH